LFRARSSKRLFELEENESHLLQENIKELSLKGYKNELLFAVAMNVKKVFYRI
jgi:hypothetical protein